MTPLWRIERKRWLSSWNFRVHSKSFGAASLTRSADTEDVRSQQREDLDC